MADTVESLLDRLLRDHPLPGIVVAEVRSGEEPVFHARGRTDGPSSAPITADTRFPIASVTKTFTAALCARRVAEGRWSWRQPIHELHAEFRLQDPDATLRMTLLDALTHRSGLPPHTWAWVFAPPDRTRFMRERLPNLEPTGRFDEKVRYSNLLYAAAGWLLESAGESWEDLVARDIWHALGMRDTRHAEENWLERLPALAAPHGRDSGRIPPFHACARHVIAPASEVFSTARDLATWLVFAIHDPDLAPCFEPRVETGHPRPSPGLAPLHYGIGWRVETLAGEPLVWHSGQCTGYTAWIGFRPRSRRGWVILTNRDEAIDPVQFLGYAMADRSDWLARIPAFLPAPPIPDREWTPVRLKPGVYAHAGYGVVTIGEDGSSLRLNASAPGPVGKDPVTDQRAWQIPGYGKRIGVSEEAGAVFLALEPALPPVRFAQA